MLKKLGEYLAAWGLLTLLRFLPFPLALRTAECLGTICGLCTRRWRRLADSNLHQAMPELDGDQRKTIQRGMFQNLGRVALALAKAPFWSRAKLQKHVEFKGLKHFQQASDLGHGVILLTAHLGNWELGALAHGALVGHLQVVVRPIENKFIDVRITRLRSTHGNCVIPKYKAAREILKALHNKETVGILADQNTLIDEAVFIDFFKKKASANKAFAQLATHSGAAVVPAITWWDQSKQKHVVEYGPAIEIIQTENPENDVFTNTQQFQKALEDRIRLHPEQWLWIHQRWKTQPTGSEVSKNSIS